MTTPASVLQRQLRALEAENQRLRDLVACLRRDHADYRDLLRKEVARCSNQ